MDDDFPDIQVSRLRADLRRKEAIIAELVKVGIEAVLSIKVNDDGLPIDGAVPWQVGWHPKLLKAIAHATAEPEEKRDE